MLDVTLPVHPLTGLTALGVLPSGRIVWPVLGAAPDDQDDDGDGGQGDDDGGDAGDGKGGAGDDDLGDAGKRALSEERRARRDAERARKAAESERDELRAKLEANGSGKKDGDGAGDQPDAEQIRRDADKAATQRANERILRSEIRAAAAGKLADPADALAHLDLSKFEVGDDGTVDEQDIADAIGDLLKKKPYLSAATAGRFEGTGDGGARGKGAGPKQVTETEFKAMSHEQRVKARQEGRLVDVLGG